MFLEEMGGIIDKKTLLEIYKIATQEAYSFLYVKLNAKSLDNMFMINYNRRIKITDE